MTCAPLTWPWMALHIISALYMLVMSLLGGWVIVSALLDWRDQRRTWRG